MTHFEQLLSHISDLRERRFLDIGSGRGKLLFDALTHRASTVVGVEPYEEYRKLTQKKARELGTPVTVMEGTAEQLPFPEYSFDFANVNEVFEHIESPSRMLVELNRVLTSGGFAYVSVPNRFGLKDPHYHLYGINWLPRFFAEKVISVLGKSKSSYNAGRQTLSEMHYMTFSAACSLFERYCFRTQDIRELRIQKIVPKPLVPLALTLYRFLRFWYFDTFHFLLKKD